MTKQNSEIAETLITIAKIAVEHSGGRLRLAHNEQDQSNEFEQDAGNFLKLDDQRLGRDLELYRFLGDKITGWETTILSFLEEILLPIKGELPESYAKAGESLRTLGESVFSENMHADWRKLF